jgi:YD repeat-containing protein
MIQSRGPGVTTWKAACRKNIQQPRPLPLRPGPLTHTIQYDDGIENVTFYEYDDMGNPTAVHTGLDDPDDVEGGAVTRYVYDQRGKVVSMTDPLGQEETTEYNALSMPISKVDRNGNTTSYAYDPMGQLLTATVTDPGDTVIGQTESSYTATGMKASDSNGTFTAEYTYDSAGRLSTRKPKRAALSKPIPTTSRQPHRVYADEGRQHRPEHELCL